MFTCWTNLRLNYRLNTREICQDQQCSPVETERWSDFVPPPSFTQPRYRMELLWCLEIKAPECVLLNLCSVACFFFQMFRIIITDMLLWQPRLYTVRFAIFWLMLLLWQPLCVSTISLDNHEGALCSFGGRIFNQILITTQWLNKQSKNNFIHLLCFYLQDPSE